MTQLFDLPCELIAYILEFLPPESAFAFSHVNKSSREFAHDLQKLGHNANPIKIWTSILRSKYSLNPNFLCFVRDRIPITVLKSKFPCAEIHLDESDSFLDCAIRNSNYSFVYHCYVYDLNCEVKRLRISHKGLCILITRAAESRDLEAAALFNFLFTNLQSMRFTTYLNLVKKISVYPEFYKYLEKCRKLLGISKKAFVKHLLKISDVSAELLAHVIANYDFFDGNVVDQIVGFAHGHSDSIKLFISACISHGKDIDISACVSRLLAEQTVCALDAIIHLWQISPHTDIILAIISYCKENIGKATLGFLKWFAQVLGIDIIECATQYFGSVIFVDTMDEITPELTQLCIKTSTSNIIEFLAACKRRGNLAPAITCVSLYEYDKYEIIRLIIISDYLELFLHYFTPSGMFGVAIDESHAFWMLNIAINEQSWSVAAFLHVYCCAQPHFGEFRAKLNGGNTLSSKFGFCLRKKIVIAGFSDVAGTDLDYVRENDVQTIDAILEKYKLAPSIVEYLNIFLAPGAEYK